MKNIQYYLIFVALIFIGCSDQEVTEVGPKPKNILVLGNSITWCPPTPEVGWNNAWGMAASEPSKDFISQLRAKLQVESPEIVLKGVNVFPFERGFDNFDFAAYDSLLDFKPDIIVIRYGENVDASTVESDNLKIASLNFMNYFFEDRPSKVIVTTTFWNNAITNDQLRRLAAEQNWELVELSDLGDYQENMAIGKFDNVGVATHPGDLGMERIANRIFSGLKKYIK
ncbi:SGNH/GDSL hydrolase family protein [Belliella aquatica]|nr:SGNH/GDSL hydrolase family protein [Belliella aquatica]